MSTFHGATSSVTTSLVAVVERAAHRAGLSEKALALECGISPAQWSHQKSGEGHIALDRLALAPLAFRRALVEELAIEWGVVSPLDALRDEVHQLLVAVTNRTLDALSLSAADAAGKAS